MKEYTRYVLLVLVLLFLVTFSVKNSHPVRLTYYFQIEIAEIPLYLLIYLCVLLGGVVALVGGYPSRHRLKKSLKSLERETRILKERSALPPDPVTPKIDPEAA